MSAPINVYIVWYGSWSSNNRATITNFILSLGTQNADVSLSARRWWKTTGLYFNRLGNYLSQSISLRKQVFDSYSYGKRLSEKNVVQVVYNQMKAKKLPLDRNGIFLVLTSGDVTVSAH